MKPVAKPAYYRERRGEHITRCAAASAPAGEVGRVGDLKTVGPLIPAGKSFSVAV